jgi:hypothetical protein
MRTRWTALVVSRIEEYAVDGRDVFMASHLIQDGVISGPPDTCRIESATERRLEGVDLELAHRAVERDVHPMVATGFSKFVASFMAWAVPGAAGLLSGRFVLEWVE